MTDRQSPQAAAVAEAAQGWLLRLHMEETTEADRARFSQWLDASRDHVKAYAEAEALWRDIALIDDIDEGVPGS